MRRGAFRSPEFYTLGVLSLLTRLWGLFDPAVVVWDETHFEKFAGAYFTHRYYVDVHPPLGKLLLAGAARLLGVSGATLAAAQPAPLLRLLPAIAGALVIPVVYVLARELGGSRRMATLAGSFLLLDNALLAESRLIVMDSMLILAGVSAVLFYVMARRRDGVWHDALLLAAAVAAGVAVSIKWTGLSAPGLIFLAWVADAFRQRREPVRLFGEGLALVVVPCLVYIVSFAVHFALLDHSGPGDNWMSPAFRTTLVGNPGHVPGATVPLAASIAELHRVVTAINLGWATDKNAGASPWYSWPIARHSIGFWTAPDGSGARVRWIVLFANPVVWISALAGLGAGTVAAFRRRPVPRSLVFLGAAYVINLVPFAFITRPMYLYHYFFALVFSLLFGVMSLGGPMGWMTDDEERFWAFPSPFARRWYVGLLTAATMVFMYLAPMSYGWPLSESGVVHRRWLIERHR